MTLNTKNLDSSFIERQRRSLTQLRAELLMAARDDEAEEAGMNSERGEGAREYEDDAQRMAMLELSGNLVVREVARLDRVNRALDKIDEGSYGLSDLSGEAIPRDRLEAVPESIFTLAEEEARERRESPSH